MEHESLKTYLRSMHTAKTAISYNYSIVQFLRSNPEAEKYGYQNIIDYLLELKEAGHCGMYRSKILASIKKYYEYLLHTGIRSSHPCRRLHIRDNRQKGMNFHSLFTLQELELLLTREERYRYLNDRNKLLISFLIYQGITSEEVTKLTTSDIDLEDATIRIKGSKLLHGRTLPLRASQLVYITKYLEESRPFLLGEHKSTNRLFLNKLGKEETVDGIHAMIQPLKPLFANRKLCPSTIRKSVISYWLNVRNIPIEDVQQMAGHKWPSSTERYKRVDMEEQRILINQLHPLNDV